MSSSSTGGIRYDFDSDASSLVRAAGQAADAMARAEKGAQKLTEKLDNVDKASNKAGQGVSKGSKSLNELARELNNNQLISQAETISALFIQMGGNVSRVASVLTSLIRPLALVGTALGPSAPLVAGLAAIPIALFGIPAAANAAGAALVDMSRDAVKLQDDIKDMVPRDITDSLYNLETQIKALDDQAKIHTATLTVALQPATEAYMHIVAGLRKEIDDAMPSVRGWLETINDTPVETAIRGAAAVMTFGISEYVGHLQRAGAAEIDRQRNLLANYIPAQKDATKYVDEFAKVVDKLNKEYDKADKEAQKFTKAQDKIRDAFDEIIQWSAEDLLTEEGKISAAINKHIEDLYDLELAEEETSLGVIALKQREAREINALWDERVKNAFKSLEQEKLDAEAFARDTERIIADMEASTRDFLVDQAGELDKQLAESKANMENALFDLAASVQDIFGEIGASILAEFEGIRDQYTTMADESESRIDDLEQKAEDLRGRNQERAKEALEEEKARLEELAQLEYNAALAAFRSEQQMKVSQVLMAGALAIMQAYAQLGPIAGSVAAVGIGGLTATQLAIIQDQDPPQKRHDGGADEVPFGNRTARSGEVALFLNQRAVESGAIERMTELNRDTGTTQQSQGGRLVLADAGRVIGEAVVSESRRPGSQTRRAFGSSNYGQRDPYGRGRR